MGGSDQWGNITAGIDLIRKLRAASRRTDSSWPLMKTASGTKFGKTEGGHVWLDPERTVAVHVLSVLAEHRRSRRRDLLKFFTFLDRPAIAGPRAGRSPGAPEKREAQRVLAREVTTLVHGADRLRKAEHASELLFGEDITDVDRRRRAGGVR